MILLGIIQGVTEWLPISSTGHLKVFEILCGVKAPILFDVILHLGTLSVIVVFFRNEVRKIVSALLHFNFKTAEGKIVPLLVAGVIPTMLIGMVFGYIIQDIFQALLPIGIAFLLGGVIIYSTRYVKEKKDNVDYTTAILMGIAQGIAIIPGVSRSGVTIGVALLLGISREKAFKFSFLLSIPTIIGALGYTLYTELGELITLGFGDALTGTVVAMVVGFITLRILWQTIKKRKFHLFALYCWFLGLVLMLLSV